MRPNPVLLLCLCLLPLQAFALVRVWFAPAGKGDGSSREQPRAWDVQEVNTKYLGNWAADPEVEFNLLPGEYLTAPINTATTEPSRFRLTIRGHGRRPEDTVLKLAPNQASGASDHGTAWVGVIDLNRNAEYLDRFVAENLTVDGGWDLQTSFNHPGYLRGFKDSPLQVAARTGRISRVLIRNFGAHGLMPRGPNDSGAGVEIFPLAIVVKDEGQSPEGDDPACWVIEDCEVVGFHPLYAGYGTMIMVGSRMDVPGVTPKWAADDLNRRLVLVRRNQVRGGPDGAGMIVFGTAAHEGHAAGKITFADNVVATASLGFNTDTGVIQHLDFTNSLFLDLVCVGNLGQPDSGPNHAGYTLKDCSIRLFGGPDSVAYDDFAFTNVVGRLQKTRPDQVRLGVRRPDPASGLQIAGAARDIRFTDNWLTAAPVGHFNRFNPHRKEDAAFRLLYKMESMKPLPGGLPARRRPDALNVELSGNRLSSVPWDFSQFDTVSAGKVASLGENSAPTFQQRRRPLPASAGFEPVGNVERVHALYTNLPRRYVVAAAATNRGKVNVRRTEQLRVEPHLIGAEELILANPGRSERDGTFTIQARLALQPTPLSGLSGTRPLAGRRVWLEVLPGSRHPQKLSAETDRRGFATFSYPVSAGVDGVDSFRAWVDVGEGEAGRWDEFQDAWCSGEFAHGTTVSLLAEIDVADQRFDREAILRLTRTGDLRDALSVSLAAASVGPTGGNSVVPDVEVSGLGNAADQLTKAAAGVWKVPFAVGERTVRVRVANPDKAKRGTQVARFFIRPARGYAPGTEPSAHVVLYRPDRDKGR